MGRTFIMFTRRRMRTCRSLRRAEYRRTQAAEAIAQAKAGLAARGLFATLVQDYYGLAIAQRKLIGTGIMKENVIPSRLQDNLFQ